MALHSAQQGTSLSALSRMVLRARNVIRFAVAHPRLKPPYVLHYIIIYIMRQVGDDMRELARNKVSEQVEEEEVEQDLNAEELDDGYCDEEDDSIENMKKRNIAQGNNDDSRSILLDVDALIANGKQIVMEENEVFQLPPQTFSKSELKAAAAAAAEIEVSSSRKSKRQSVISSKEAKKYSSDNFVSYNYNKNINVGVAASGFTRKSRYEKQLEQQQQDTSQKGVSSQLSIASTQQHKQKANHEEEVPLLKKIKSNQNQSSVRNAMGMIESEGNNYPAVELCQNSEPISSSNFTNTNANNQAATTNAAAAVGVGGTSKRKPTAAQAAILPFQSYCPDLVLQLIDNVINVDSAAVLRRSFAKYYLDDILAENPKANLIRSSDSENSGYVQRYLPFEFTKPAYPMKKIKLESFGGSSSSTKRKIGLKYSSYNNDTKSEGQQQENGNGEKEESEGSDEDIFEDINREVHAALERKRILESSYLSEALREMLILDTNYICASEDVGKFRSDGLYMEPHASCLANTSATNLDVIRKRAESNAYDGFLGLDRDMRKMFNYTLRYRCTSPQSYEYVTRLIRAYYDNVMLSDIVSRIDAAKRDDMQRLLNGDLDNKMFVKKWPIVPTSYRSYEQIDKYAAEPESSSSAIRTKLKSGKQAVPCERRCVCNSFTKMGEFNLETSTWSSTCKNRSKRIECSESDCSCKNQQISNEQRKVLGKDVEETLCWGFDLYTKKNLFYLLPESLNDKQKTGFLSVQLLKAINLQREKGWDLEHSCSFILQESASKLNRLQSSVASVNTLKKQFNNESRKCAKSVLRAIKYVKRTQLDPNNLNETDPEGVYAEAFRVHTKGMGLICVNPKGIEKNELITEYIGEIYQPWRWYERQEVIKKYLKEHHSKNILPDFWNIMLEIHKDDPKGYDILFVDPINKGNFSSRLSHSCEPNCGTVPSISNKGDYAIGMFAMQSITYGEELTFDYMAVTESVLEHKRAVCLCGMAKCRGKYLDLSNSNIRQFNSILEKIHCFLDRTSTLFQVCKDSTLNKEDEDILNTNYFRANLLDGCPMWLKKWVAEILRVIDLEYKQFQQELSDSTHNRIVLPPLTSNLAAAAKYSSMQLQKGESVGEDVKLQPMSATHHYQALSRRDARIQNLVISIDKVKYYLNSIHDHNAPLIEMTAEETLERLWLNADTSIRNDLKEISQSIQESKAREEFENRIEAITKEVRKYRTSGDIQKGLLAVRVGFIVLSDVLLHRLPKDSLKFQYEGVALILHFMAFTHEYFETYSYKKFTSPEVIVKKSDIINVELFDSDKQNLSGNTNTNNNNLTHPIKKSSCSAGDTSPPLSAVAAEAGAVKPAMNSNGSAESYVDKKVYSSLFVWGQLNMWYKQTVTNPPTTLSLERRGPLIYPQLVFSFKDPARIYPFADSKHQQNQDNPEGKDSFLDHLKSRPDMYWPIDSFNKWSFKNSMNFYGSFLFDGLRFKDILPEYTENVIDSHEESLEERIVLLRIFETKIGKLPEVDINDVVENIVRIGTEPLQQVSQEPVQPQQQEQQEQQQQNKKSQQKYKSSQQQHSTTSDINSHPSFQIQVPYQQPNEQKSHLDPIYANTLPHLQTQPQSQQQQAKLQFQQQQQQYQQQQQQQQQLQLSQSQQHFNQAQFYQQGNAFAQQFQQPASMIAFNKQYGSGNSASNLNNSNHYLPTEFSRRVSMNGNREQSQQQQQSQQQAMYNQLQSPTMIAWQQQQQQQQMQQSAMHTNQYGYNSFTSALMHANIPDSMMQSSQSVYTQQTPSTVTATTGTSGSSTTGTALNKSSDKHLSISPQHMSQQQQQQYPQMMDNSEQYFAMKQPNIMFNSHPAVAAAAAVTTSDMEQFRRNSYSSGGNMVADSMLSPHHFHSHQQQQQQQQSLHHSHNGQPAVPSQFAVQMQRAQQQMRQQFSNGILTQDMKDDCPLNYYDAYMQIEESKVNHTAAATAAATTTTNTEQQQPIFTTSDLYNQQAMMGAASYHNQQPTLISSQQQPHSIQAHYQMYSHVPSIHSMHQYPTSSSQQQQQSQNNYYTYLSNSRNAIQPQMPSSTSIDKNIAATAQQQQQQQQMQPQSQGIQRSNIIESQKMMVLGTEKSHSSNQQNSANYSGSLQSQRGQYYENVTPTPSNYL